MFRLGYSYHKVGVVLEKISDANSQQDDLFNSYQSACFVGGAFGFLTFGLSLTALSPYFNFYPTFYEYFLAFAIGTVIGGYSFYRKYIAES
mgnify:CR=1 FL=1